MTAVSDATTAELAENDLIAVPKAEWNAMQDRIDTLETELAQHKDHTGREFADVRGRITDVEDDVEDIEARNQQTEAASGDETPIHEGGTERSTDEQTPLERICALPKQITARELTANQGRARFIAKDVHDYAEKCPAGLILDSRAIKRVIIAVEGTRPHTQTVARVMEFLDDLGKGGVDLTKRRGRKLLVFDPEVADRLVDASAETANHRRCDRRSEPAHPTGVIP